MKVDSWNAKLYDEKHSFVSNYGKGIVELLDAKPNETILDVGCGTGDLAFEISQTGATIIGIDSSEQMIQTAKLKYPELQFQIENVLQLPFQEQFDALFSNATLHWIKSPNEAIRNIYHALKPNGRFVAEFGGYGNVKIITDALIEQIKLSGLSFTEADFPWYFPTVAGYAQLLEHAGFEIRLIELFDRPTPLVGEDGLLNWLEMFSPTFFTNVDDKVKVQIFKDTENQLKNMLYRNGQWFADYRRLRVVANKLDN